MTIHRISPLTPSQSRALRERESQETREYYIKVALNVVKIAGIVINTYKDSKLIGAAVYKWLTKPTVVLTTPTSTITAE
jgi:hypothetical protein